MAATVDAGTSDAALGVDLIAGASTPWGGLALRLSDTNNFLLVRYQTNLTLSRVQSGVVTDLGSSSPAPPPAGSRHRIEAHLRGTLIQVYWDDVFQFELNSTFQQTMTRHGIVWQPAADTATALDSFDLYPQPDLPSLTDRLDREGDSVSFSAAGSDPLGSILTYSATNLPPEFTINSTTGMISGALNSNSAAIYQTRVRAIAGSRFAERGFQWTVRCPANDYLVSPFSLEAPDPGNNTLSTTVNAPDPCPWVATSQSDFVTIVDPSVHLGTQVVQFALTNNTYALPRVGATTVADQTVLLNQPGNTGQTCSFTFQPSVLQFSQSGSTATVSFTATNDWCQWMAAAWKPWLHVIGAANGVGSGSVTVSADPNYTGAERDSSLAIDNSILPVQELTDGCSFRLDYTTFTAPASEDDPTRTVHVLAPNGCGWDATSQSSFLQIYEIQYDNGAGTGNGHVRFHIDNNPDTASRTGTLIVAKQTVTVSQSGVSEDVLYYHTDAIGSVRLITDATGAVKATYDYFPFGQEWNANAFHDPRMFTGQERDRETDSGVAGWGALDYFGARYYQSQLGRFVGADSAEHFNLVNSQSVNLFAYGYNNPFRYVDPTGHDGECPQPDTPTYACVSAPAPADPFVIHVRIAELEDLFGREGTSLLLNRSVPVAQVAGFVIGVAQSVGALAKKGPPSCLGIALGSVASVVSPIPLAAEPSGTDAIGPALEAWSAAKWNAALQYAASKANYLGGTGLLYPMKSQVFRTMAAGSRLLADAAPLALFDAGIWTGVADEMRAASAGQCR